MYDLIIIGSGPAGLSAAVYAKRAGLNLVVLEKKPMSGGQVLNTYEVDNYLGMPGSNGFDMGMAFRAHAEKLGVTFRMEEVQALLRENGNWVIRTKKETYESKAVIMATGAEHAKLEVPGEERLAGAGVSYCATCDGAFFRGKKAAVVGGGDAALEDAIYLARGCEKVYLIHRRDELRGAKILQEELKELPNVEILYHHVVEEIQGKDMVEAVKIRDTGSNEEKILSLSGVFVAVGIRPDTSLLKDLISCDEAGYVYAEEDCKTTQKGLFVAGDIRRKPLRQIVTAVADGANAVASVEKYFLEENM